MPVDRALPALLAFAAVGATAAVEGGYFPAAWGWSALGLLLAAATALLIRERIDLGPLEYALLAGLAAFLLWIGLSATWSESLPRTVLEIERGLVYLAAAAALFALATRRSLAPVAGGVLAAIVAVSTYALATRLFPDRFGYDPAGGYQLARPLGYWNALGVLAAVGTVLALGFAAGGRARAVRVLAAGSLAVLAPTLYFTFSRGAWVALGAGLAAVLVLEPRRLRLATTALALAPVPALAVWLGSRSTGLARERAPLEVAAREGHRLAAILLVLAVGSALVALGLEQAERKVRIGPGARRGAAAALLALAAAAVVAVLVRAGGPQALVEKAYDSFRAPLPQSGGDLERRLFSLSGNGRADYWRVAWEEYSSHPWLGTGSGTYELWWNRERPTAFGARDAHNLYLETLAELGPVGLLLLALTLATPLLAVPAVRREPLGAAAAAAYVAYLLHAAVDWDWELPAVTLTGLLSAGALLVAARRPEGERPLSTPVRAGALAVGAALGALIFVGYAGNGALASSEDAAARGEFAEAAAEARRATRWAGRPSPGRRSARRSSRSATWPPPGRAFAPRSTRTRATGASGTTSRSRAGEAPGARRWQRPPGSIR